MNDDQQFELASAYIDGAVNDEERARVESDGELLALVRELRSISTAVSDAPPASDAARETAIAAALAAFDQLSSSGRAGEPTDVMPATPVEIPPAPSLAGVDESSVAPGDALVVPLAPRRRFRLGHAVSVAAAAVVVMAGGVALLRDNAEAPTNEAGNEARQTLAPLPTDVTGPGGPRTTAVVELTNAPATAVTTFAAAPTVAATTVPAPAGAPAPTQRADATEQVEDGAVAGDATERENAGDTEIAADEPDAAIVADDDGEQGSAATPSELPPAAPAPGPAEATMSSSDTDASTAAADAGPAIPLPAATAALPPNSAAASEMATSGAPVEPPELTTREEFAEFADTLAEPPLTMSEVAPGSSVTNYSPAITPEMLPLDQALARCLTPGTDPLASDAVYVTEDGVSHPIALVLVGDEELAEYGGVDVVTCTLVVDTAEPSLVTTTTVAETTTTPAG